MPLLERSTTLTASASPDGIYVYTKTKQGRITQARNTITTKQLADAFQNKQDQANHEILRHSIQWKEDVLDLTCSPHSTLCGVTWDAYSQSIFYQNDKGFICEWRKLNDEPEEWMDFSTPLKGLRGTNIAVVHAVNGSRAMLFYQDEDHFVCCSSAHFRQWTTWKRIAKATESTGIGATSRNDTGEFRLYFQDEQLSIREFKGPFMRLENLTNTPLPLKMTEPIGDITAISWEAGSKTEIRLYLQDANDNIIDFSWDGSECNAGSLNDHCFPNADIIAVLRDIGTGQEPSINVFWVGEDQKLYQRVRVGDASDWHRDTAHKIMEVSDVGTFAGSLSGTKFSDADGKLDDRHVHAVNVRVYGADVISAVGFEFTDGTNTPMHGGMSGTIKQFVLQDNEDIIHMSVVTSPDPKRIQGLKFGTSKGRSSEWYGLEDDSRSQLWSKSGHPLTGFAGAIEDVVRGLKPLWATRQSIDVNRSPQLLEEADTLNQVLTAARSTIINLLSEVDRFGEQLGNEVFKYPIEQIIALTGSLEYLNDLTRRTCLEYIDPRQKEVSSQRDSCATGAGIVENALQHVIRQSAKHQERSRKLAIEINEALSTFDERVKRLDLLLIELNAVRIVLQTETESLKNAYKFAVQQAIGAHDNHLSQKQQDRANNTRAECKADYDANQEKLDQIDLQIKILGDLRNGIAQEDREKVRADVRSVPNRLASSLAIYTRFSDRFNKTYANGKPLHDPQDARDLARKLLKLVRLVFEEPSIKEQVGRGKVKPDQLLGALASVADVGN